MIVAFLLKHFRSAAYELHARDDVSVFCPACRRVVLAKQWSEMRFEYAGSELDQHAAQVLGWQWECCDCKCRIAGSVQSLDAVAERKALEARLVSSRLTPQERSALLLEPIRCFEGVHSWRRAWRWTSRRLLLVGLWGMLVAFAAIAWILVVDMTIAHAGMLLPIAVCLTVCAVVSLAVYVSWRRGQGRRLVRLHVRPYLARCYLPLRLTEQERDWVIETMRRERSQLAADLRSADFRAAIGRVV